jgi:predicted glycosyltransferase
MNWETVTSGIGQKVYALWGNGRKLLTLAFNSSSNFVKIESGGEKRAFTLRYEGFLKNKMVMRNEYGVRIGHVSSENKEHLIAFNDEKLFYTITNDKEPQVIVYKESVDKPLVVCALKLDNDKSVLPSVKPAATQQSLLLALCWYLFQPVVQENVREYA